MNTKNPQLEKPAFKLKGSVLTVSVLQLLHIDDNRLEQQLQEVVQKNINFFQHMPVIIDLQKLYSSQENINFVDMMASLRSKGFVPVGILHGNEKQILDAVTAGLAVLPNKKSTQAPSAPKRTDRSKVISQPIRSGQQVYAKNTDLIVLASVSHGAEILADGNIHVYGALRGRAIAGATGDTNARIFCHKLEAELVSIAGYYKVQDELRTVGTENGVQVFLEEEHIVIAPIN